MTAELPENEMERLNAPLNEARQWLFPGCPEAPFSLRCVCSLLGVDPHTVQRTMSDWARRKRAGLAAVRLPRAHAALVKEHHPARIQPRWENLRREVCDGYIPV
jgi:hypothetical protein